MAGFLQLHRRVYSNPVFADLIEASVFVWLTSQAAWKPVRVRYKDKVVSLERGQLAISVRDLAQKWGWSKSKAERYIHRATHDNMIETVTETGITIITICNYDKYQNINEADETPTGTGARHQPGQERDSTETQNNKVINKLNKITNNLVREKFEEFWNAFDDKRGREPALKSWLKINPDEPLADKIISGARQYAQWRSACKPKDQTGKMAQGWLTDQRWNDVVALPTGKLSEKADEWENEEAISHVL